MVIWKDYSVRKFTEAIIRRKKKNVKLYIFNIYRTLFIYTNSLSEIYIFQHLGIVLTLGVIEEGTISYVNDA